jgi:hypothetical protein
MEDTRWDHGLKVTGEGEGLVGHAGTVLLRKLADQAGLTAALGSALTRAGKFPLIDRSIALVSMAVAIALGATSMTDITLLAHLAAVLGPEPSPSIGAWLANTAESLAILLRPGNAGPNTCTSAAFTCSHLVLPVSPSRWAAANQRITSV